jgi:hypothetical protein
MTSFIQTAKKRTRRTGILLCTLLLILFTTQQCSGPEEIIEQPEETGKKDPPNEEKPGNNDPKENTKVDKSGGKVFKDKITLVVPADAFNTPVTMEITVQTDGAVMEEFEASPYYKIKLPRNFAKPIQLQLLADTEITENEIYFRITTPGIEISSQQEGSSVMWIKGVKEGDYYTATMEPFEEPSDEQGELIVGLVKNYQASNESGSRAITSDRKCVVYAPRFYHEESKEIALHLEEAIKRLEAVGFSFAKRNKQIQVEVKKLSGADAYGYFIPSRYSSEWNSMVINSQKLSEKEEIKRTIMHEMTHFAQYYYDPRWTVTKSYFEGEFLWMEEAVAVWAESLYVAGISSVQYGNQFCPLEGFSPWDKEDKSTHGYGMAGLIRWMANRYGNDKIVKLHQQQEAGATSVMDAFEDAFPDLFLEYGIFLQDYVRGNGVKDLIQSMARDYLKLNDMNEVKTKAPPQCKPYSARYEKIFINPDFKLPDSKIILSINVEGGVDGGKGQYCELYRYDSKKKEVVFVESFYDSYQFEDVESLQEKREILYVVYYHPYNKECEVNMTVRLEEKLEFVSGKISLYINELNNYSGFFTATFPDELVVPITSATGTTSYSGNRVIYTSNSSYSKKESYDKVESEWEISIEIDAVSRKILKGTARNITSRYNDRAGDPNRGKLKRRQTTSISFKDIPFIRVFTYDGHYGYEASDRNGSIGTYLTAFSNKLETEGINGWTTKTVTSWKPNTKWSVGASLYIK